MSDNKPKHKLQSVTRNSVRLLRSAFTVLIILLLAIAARLLPGPRIVDDAYITFRYARNLVEGNGFVYNPGERALGTTTPLYTLLMAGLSLMTGSRDFPTLALVVNALSGAAAVGLLYALGKRFANHQAPALAAALLWALAPHSVSYAIGGMETDLTITLLLAASYAHVTNRPRAMATLSALALLARPDTAILIGLLWLDLIRVQRRIPWDIVTNYVLEHMFCVLRGSNKGLFAVFHHGMQSLRVKSRCQRRTNGQAHNFIRCLPWQEGIITLTLLAPWLIFGTLYFGSPLTNSVAAKAVTYRLRPDEGFIRLLQHYATPFFEHNVLPSIGVFVIFVLYCALCSLGGLRTLRRERRTWPLTVYPFAYFGVFAVANPLIFRWYLSPPLPFYFLLILTGVWTLANDVGKLAMGKARTSTRPLICSSTILALFTAAALALTLNAWDLHPDHGPDRPAPEMAWFELELLYEQAAQVVLSHAAPGDTLCAGDIGMLGYRTDLHILDTVGLVTPKSTQHYPTDPEIYVTNYAIPADLVLALDPDYIVILEVYGRRGLLPDPRFQARYQLLERLDTDVYGSDGMLIFGASAR